MTGLEIIEALAAGDIPRPPLAELLDMSIDDVAPGRVTFGLDVDERLYNPLGSVHGGVLSTLLDSAMGCAVHTTLPEELTFTTVELHVNFVRAVRAGGSPPPAAASWAPTAPSMPMAVRPAWSSPPPPDRSFRIHHGRTVVDLERTATKSAGSAVPV